MLGASVGRRGFSGAAEDGANSCHQLTRIKRLGQVVVGANFKAKNAIDGFASGGEQEYRNRRLTANRLQQLESRAARQHDIEDNQFVITGQGGGQSRSVVIGGIHLEAFAFEKALEKINESVVVIHDEQPVHGIYFALSRARRR